MSRWNRQEYRRGKAAGRASKALGLRTVALAGGFLLAFSPQALRACAACYGQSDSPLAQGLNWGIFSLLVVIVAVLGGVASFFVYLARKSAGAAATRGGPILAQAVVPPPTLTRQMD